jgi:hypothetical protein
MTSNTPHQAQPASIRKHHRSCPRPIKFVEPPALFRSSARSGGEDQRQESARGRVAGTGVRRGNTGYTILGARPSPLAGAYFNPAIALMAERNLPSETARNDLIHHLRVTEERRLFHSWRQCADQSANASKHKTAESRSTTTPDILSYFRTTDDERKFLQWLRGDF